MTVLLITLTLLSVSAMLALIARADAGHAAPGELAEPDQEAPEAAMVRLLFATHAADAQLVVDGVSEPDGWPFTVCVAWTPPVAYAGPFIDSILERWTSTGTALAMQIVEGADGPEVCLCGADSRVRLPIAA